MNEGACIIVVDDHPLFREALQQVLAAGMPGLRFIGVDGFDALQAALHDSDEADLVLLDLDIPGAKGFSVLSWLRTRHPALPVAVVSATDDPGVMRRAVDHGAAGFIPKSSPAEVIHDAIAAVLEGDVWLPEAARAPGEPVAVEQAALARRVASLTPQQLRVLDMLASGLLNKQIAAELQVSEATVKGHATLIFRKLGVRSRTQAAVAVRSLQALAQPDPG